MNKVTYGDGAGPGFTELWANGKKIEFAKGAPAQTVWVDHFYRVGGYNSDAPRVHACLFMGYWCWKNALDHPKFLPRYLKIKFRYGVLLPMKLWWRNH